MKKSRIITLVALAALMVAFTACNDDADQVTSDLDALELESDAALETTYESIDQITEGGIAFADGARTDVNGPHLEDCATVDHNTETKVITIDFGDGCEDRHGNVRKGKIVIEYNDRKYVPDAFRIVTFVDFFFNDIGVEGTRTITNTSSVDSELEFTVTLVGGKLDFGDGTFATRDAEWVRTWFVGEGEVTLSGGAHGTNINGAEYSTSVSESTPLLFLRECAMGIPVAGVKEITVGDRSASINFGDGGCDRMVAITINGETFIKELKPRNGQGR